jgi:hypothetical protein
VDSGGRTIFVADAHRGDNQRFVVLGGSKADRVYGIGISDPRLRRIGLTSSQDFDIFQDSTQLNEPESGGGLSPR